jgi:glycosyltransferase involved in cell wall biosynthesis
MRGFLKKIISLSKHTVSYDIVQAMTERKKQSVILIPAYQPGDALINTTKELLDADFSVVVVDDGSGVEYSLIFTQLDPRVRVITHDKNQGKGAALKTGYRYIQTNFGDDFVIITADADGQHKVGDIEKIAEAYRGMSGELLLGARTFSGDDVPFRSRFGNELTRKIFTLVTRQTLHDTQTGLRAFDASLVNFMLQVKGERFEYETNVLLECSRNEIPMSEYPIQTVYENNNQTSHFNPIKDSWAIYKEILKFASSSLLSFAVDYGAFILLVALTSSWSTCTRTACLVRRWLCGSGTAGRGAFCGRRVPFRQSWA